MLSITKALNSISSKEKKWVVGGRGGRGREGENIISLILTVTNFVTKARD